MPKTTIAGGTRLTPATSKVVKLNPACWVAAPNQAKTPAPAPLTTSTSERHQEPPAEPRRTGHRAGQEVVERAARLLGAGRGDLTGGDEGDQDASMRKQTPSTASAPVPVAPSLENTSSTEPEIVAPADFAMSP